MNAKYYSNIIPASNTHLPLGFCPCKYHHFFFFLDFTMHVKWILRDTAEFKTNYWKSLLTEAQLSHSHFFLPHHRGFGTSASVFPLVHSLPLILKMCLFPTLFDIIKLARVSSNLLEQTKVLAQLSWMVNIITECVTAENVASSICPHAAGLSGISTICLLAGK